MAKTWYPVIDYLTCAECGTCVAKCPHDVYDAAKAPSEACIDHCHGCGDRCPVGAITYVGDDTGWTPPKGERAVDEMSCSCGWEATSENKIVVEYLYLDLQTCDRCIGTDNVLDEVMLTLTPALALAGFEVIYNKTEMKTAKLAEQSQFLSSPTIRVNGKDICQSVAENSCGCCSDISGIDVDCRVFEYYGETYEIPPKEMLARAILQAVFGRAEAGCSFDNYELPENLKNFFEGKEAKSQCSRGRNCF